MYLWMVDPPPLFFAHIVVTGCPSNVRPSWQPPVRPSIFSQQYLSPKPLRGISPFFTGLIGLLSELLKCPLYKEIWVPW